MVAGGSAAVVLVLGYSALRSVCSQDVNCRGLLQLDHAGTTAAPPVLEQQLHELDRELKGLEIAEFLSGGRTTRDHGDLLEDTVDAAKVEHSQEATDAEGTDQHVAPNSSATMPSITISLLELGSKFDKVVEAVDSLGSSISTPTLVVIIASHVIIASVILYLVWKFAD